MVKRDLHKIGKWVGWLLNQMPEETNSILSRVLRTSYTRTVIIDKLREMRNGMHRWSYQWDSGIFVLIVYTLVVILPGEKCILGSINLLGCDLVLTDYLDSIYEFAEVLPDLKWKDLIEESWDKTVDVTHVLDGLVAIANLHYWVARCMPKAGSFCDRGDVATLLRTRSPLTAPWKASDDSTGNPDYSLWRRARDSIPHSVATLSLFSGTLCKTIYSSLRSYSWTQPQPLIGFGVRIFPIKSTATRHNTARSVLRSLGPQVILDRPSHSMPRLSFPSSPLPPIGAHAQGTHMHQFTASIISFWLPPHDASLARPTSSFGTTAPLFGNYACHSSSCGIATSTQGLIQHGARTRLTACFKLGYERAHAGTTPHGDDRIGRRS
ncbi:hypothetical protein OE88DRAFT_1649116 [Heliocybe sulcata]|uniref:Uncharacterized protein n=1 Tax=Heliocybe sulcata TaxID=5364 RepID=A0A5C3MLR9_9AGAM|nr:hypothetical protein OE88DRAFT_1649116 [Heliocybe sulcata]